jgi:methionyl-tRNA synthetase
MWNMLNLDGSPSSAGWESAGQSVLKEGHRLNKSEILVSKIEDKKLEEVINKLLPATSPTQNPVASVKPTITLDDFKKLDLRIATVLSAENVPKSEKLLKLQLEVGDQTKQVLAGIGQYYQPKDLVGKQLVVVANLQSAKLMGQESQGMILAATDCEGKLAVVCPLTEISSGSIVK